MVATGIALSARDLMPSAIDNSPTSSNATDERQAIDATEGGYRAKRYAVKFQPPCVFLEYEDTSQKRRVRAVKLNGINSGVDVDRLTRKIIRSFPRKLDPTSVKYEQVRKLVVKLLEHLAASEAAAGKDATAPGRLSTANGGDGAGAGSPLSPLPTVSPRLDLLSPGGKLANGPGRGLANAYRASVESNLSRFSTSTNSEEEADDELTSALDELNKELGGGVGTSTSGLSTRANLSGGSSELSSRDSSFSVRDRPAGAAGPGPGLGAAGAAGAGGMPGAGPGAVLAGGGGKSRFAAEAEKLVIGLEVTEDLDLNKVTEVELRMAKQVMEEDFRKNQLRPGDPGYEYDRQEEFGPPTETNDWDDSDEDAEPSEEPEVDWADIHAAVAKPGGGQATSPGKGKGDPSPYNSSDWP